MPRWKNLLHAAGVIVPPSAYIWNYGFCIGPYPKEQFYKVSFRREDSGDDNITVGHDNFRFVEGRPLFEYPEALQEGNTSILNRTWAIYDRFSIDSGSSVKPGHLVRYKSPINPEAYLLGRVIATGGDYVYPRKEYQDRKVYIPKGSCWIESIYEDNYDDVRYQDSNLFGPVFEGLVESFVRVTSDSGIVSPVMTKAQRSRVRLRGFQ
ncbi:hypothetical protein MP638_001527 [Amoeboaphelidium occidentale]|nr:hypothetical protein MP638_001527 [Amoeboaphelidium occidentale]